VRIWMSTSRMSAVVAPSESASAVVHSSKSMPSARSCFCAPHPPCAMFGGGLAPRRPVPAFNRRVDMAGERLPRMCEATPEEETENAPDDAHEQEPPDPEILRPAVARLLLRRQQRVAPAPDDALGLRARRGGRRERHDDHHAHAEN